MALITCENVRLGYEGKAVVDDISFAVNSGDYLCVVGENGAGKSTLIKGLLHLKKTMAGEITTGDELKQNEIGYLPQQASIKKDFPASVFEVVLSGRLNSLGWRPFYGHKDRDKANEMLELMGISDIRNKCYQDLSGGQKQRVLLARAMCATKKVLLLDEPVAGLDPVATLSMYELLADINQRMGITIIMVSHDIESALKYSSHILHLSHDGYFFGTTEEYTKSEVGRHFAAGEE